MSNKIKILLFTHIDLDGLGCSILINKVFSSKEYSVHTEYVTYDFENEKYNKNLVDNGNFDCIFITDMSVSPEYAKYLNDNCKSKLILLDHHKSANDKLSVLNYDWITIDETKSGTLLTYQYLIRHYPSVKIYADLVRYINDYDLWKWNYEDTLKYQILLSVLGRTDFVNRFMNNPSVRLSDSENSLVNMSINTIKENYHKLLNSAVEYIDNDDNKFLFIIVKDSLYMMSYVLYKILLNRKSEVDYVVAYTKYNSLSFRSLNYDVSKIAESLGGGGHKLASGVSVPTDGVYDVVKSIIDRKWIKKSFVNKKIISH